MSDKEVIEFNTHPEGELLTINIMLNKEEIAELKDVWFNKLSGIQPPLVETNKNGLNVHIPWILKGEKQ